jgi:hypothetical protein
MAVETVNKTPAMGTTAHGWYPYPFSFTIPYKVRRERKDYRLGNAE